MVIIIGAEHFPCHSREGGNPLLLIKWIPGMRFSSAGMTEQLYGKLAELSRFHRAKQMKIISKSKIKPHLLKIFRDIEKTGEEIIVTDQGKPVLKITRYSENAEDRLSTLRDTVLKYDDPTGPIGVEDWDALK